MGVRKVLLYYANRSLFLQLNFKLPKPQVQPHDLIIRTIKDFRFPPKICVLDIALISPIQLFPFTITKKIREELLNKRVIKAYLAKSQIAQKEIIGIVLR